MSTFPDVQKVGYGLMSFTWIPSRKFTQEQFNETLKQVIDKSNATVEHPILLNGGEFYGVPERHENISLIGNFFKSYPDYADKVYLSVKGGIGPHWNPDTSVESFESCFAAINKYLQPLYEARTKKPKTLDVFTMSRVGKEPIEEVMQYLGRKRSEGVFSELCLSEVSAATLEKALAVTPISCIEMEFSLFDRYLADTGVFEVTRKHNIPIICYSPLGKGLLTGIKTSDLAKDDFRNHMDRFSDQETVNNNNKLVEEVHKISQKLNMQPSQLALSWITTLSNTEFNGVKYPKLIPIPGSANAARQIENISVVTLDKETLQEIADFLSTFKISGYRYNKAANATLDI